jgi:hypothetical protein
VLEDYEDTQIEPPDVEMVPFNVGSVTTSSSEALPLRFHSTVTSVSGVSQDAVEVSPRAVQSDSAGLDENRDRDVESLDLSYPRTTETLDKLTLLELTPPPFSTDQPTFDPQLNISDVESSASLATTSTINEPTSTPAGEENSVVIGDLGKANTEKPGTQESNDVDMAEAEDTCNSASASTLDLLDLDEEREASTSASDIPMVDADLHVTSAIEHCGSDAETTSNVSIFLSVGHLLSWCLSSDFISKRRRLSCQALNLMHLWKCRKLAPKSCTKNQHPSLSRFLRMHSTLTRPYPTSSFLPLFPPC